MAVLARIDRQMHRKLKKKNRNKYLSPTGCQLEDIFCIRPTAFLACLSRGSGNLHRAAWTTPSRYYFTQFGILLACFDSVESLTPICNHRWRSQPSFPPCGHFYVSANYLLHSKEKRVSCVDFIWKAFGRVMRWAMFPHRTVPLRIIRAAGQLQCCPSESLLV